MNGTLDLKAIVVATLVLQLLIHGVPVASLRVALSLMLVLFFPGYTLISALYPRRGTLDGVERIALGIGLSLAVVPLLGLVLNFSPWGIRLTPISVALSFWILGLCGVAWWQRRRTPLDERFDMRWDAVTRWINGRKATDVVAAAVVLVAVAAIVGAVAWKIQGPSEGQAFTEFYILGEANTLQNYPTQLEVGTAQSYNIGIVNHERRPIDYDVRAYLDDQQVGNLATISLDQDEAWEGQVSVMPVTSGDGQKLEVRLTRAGDTESYRTVHLFVDVREP